MVKSCKKANARDTYEDFGSVISCFIACKQTSPRLILVALAPTAILNSRKYYYTII